MPKQTGAPPSKGQRKAVVDDTLLLNVVTRYFKLAGAISSVWFFGYQGFSVSWLLLFLVVYVWKERNNKSKKHRTQIAQDMARNEKDVILARVEDLPSWVNFPDVERAEWLNKMLDQMWPYIGEMVEGILRTSVEPAIKASLPSSLQSFKFSKIDLGDIPPRIGGVKVYTQVKRDEIYMDLEINYSSDSDIAVNIKGINAGIKDLRIHGTLRVVFKPLINKSPLIGGMLFFFLNNPDLDFNLTSLANAFDLPGLSDMLHSIILEQISNLMVLPNRFPIKLAEGLDLNKLRYPQPQGVVRVCVAEAKDLKKADISLVGKGKSDPYVILKVGAKEVKTKIINNSVTPVWNETFELIVDSADGQVMYVDVMDDDPGSKDDDLGRITMDLARVKEHGHEDEWLPLEDVNQGLIHLQMTWLYLANDPLELDRIIKQVMDENTEEEKAHAAILLVYLDSGSNLPRGKKSLVEPSPQCTLSVGQQSHQSGIKPNTIDPKWEQNFRFMIHNPNYQNLDVEIKDTKAKKTIGNVVLKLKELLVADDMVIDSKFFIKGQEPDTTLNMRVCLRVLTPNYNPSWFEPEDLIDEEEEGTSVDPAAGAAATDGKTSSSPPAKGKNNSAASAVEPDSSSDKKEASPAASSGGSAGSSPAKEQVISPAKAKSQETELRQRKAPSPTVNPAGDFGLGRIQLTLRYSTQRKALVLVVHKCSNLQPQESDSKGLADPYIKMYLLPDKSSSSKRKTKCIKDNLNPVFDESFEFNLTTEDLESQQLEMSIKNEVGMFSSSKSLMGMVIVDLATLDTSRAVTEWFDIMPEDKVKAKSLETVV